MCMNGKCGRCGAACKAPEPKLGATTRPIPAGRGPGPVSGDGLGPRPEGAGWVAKKKAEATVAKARSKR